MLKNIGLICEILELHTTVSWKLVKVNGKSEPYFEIVSNETLSKNMISNVNLTFTFYDGL